MYVLLVVLSISVSDSLKCPVCEFQLTLDGSLPDKSTLPESCEIRDEDAGLCKALMVIDHSKDYVCSVDCSQRRKCNRPRKPIGYSFTT